MLEGVKIVLAWHSLSDACPKCQQLNGKQWLNYDLSLPTLWDAQFGSVWDMDSDRSLMHGGVGTCRCQLEVKIEVDLEKVEIG